MDAAVVVDVGVVVDVVGAVVAVEAPQLSPTNCAKASRAGLPSWKVACHPLSSVDPAAFTPL